jgi:hypothetical protein
VTGSSNEVTRKTFGLRSAVSLEIPTNRDSADDRTQSCRARIFVAASSICEIAVFYRIIIQIPQAGFFGGPRREYVLLIQRPVCSNKFQITIDKILGHCRVQTTRGI